jgi:4-hydroxybenzoate polyprenyltransferase
MNGKDPLSSQARLLDYLQLMRASNVFTVVADVSMGFLLVRPELAPLGVLVALIAASILLYSAGMVFNDVFDLPRDRRERPKRPIPSGRISLKTARRLGLALLLCGLVAGWSAGFLPGAVSHWGWRGGVIATLLVVMILAYNRVLKHTPAGPLAMGSCRLLNVLLGMSAGVPLTDDWNIMGFGAAQLVASAGIGIYVTGITWFARSEASTSPRGQLGLAIGTMMLGIGMLGMVHRLLSQQQGPPLVLLEPYWWMLLGMLAVPILRRCTIAISDPEPRQVQLAVRHALWSLIMLDAALVLLVHQALALAIVALLIPTAILGKWIAST